MTSLIVHVDSPYVTQERYATMTGLTENQVKDRVHQGHLPTVKQGRTRLINVALLTKQALEAEL